jgi:hypothetical protein
MRQQVHLPLELRIGEFGARAGDRAIVNQRELIAAPRHDVPVEAIGGRVAHRIREPAAIGAGCSVKNGLGSPDPVEMAGLLTPEAFR